jgi:hypothetical protein
VTDPRRCFVCAADMLAPSTRGLAFPDGRRRLFRIACGSCGILIEPGADPDRSWRDLAGRLAAPVFVPDPEAGYGLDLYTLRSAAPRPGSAAASAPSPRRIAPPCCSPTARAPRRAPCTTSTAPSGARSRSG